MLSKVYSHLPTWAQHAAVSAYGLYWYALRFGGNYRNDLNDYLSREAFGAEDWARYQSETVAALLSAAATHVPYYRRVWGEAEKRAARAGDLHAIPLLEKDALRADPKAFLREDLSPRSTKTYHTSGSTGTPIATIWTPAEVRRSRAVREARSNRWAGVSYSLPRATFSGRMVEPNPASKGPFYRFNAVERQVYFSAFHLRPDTAPSYVRALHRHRVQWLSGYAVSFYLLAKMILEQELEVPPLKALITTSEKVTPEMRQVMERAYRCPVFEEYGTVENVVLATECRDGRLHVSPDVGVIEILRPDGSPCEPGEVGEVVATGLMRTYQTLIRYRVGDLAAWDPEPCPCGRSMPVLREIVGRVEDVIVGPDGREMVRFHGIFVNQPNIREGQIIQESLTNIRVRVVPGDAFGHADIQDIEDRVKQRLGDDVNVAIETVSHIPRTASGKFKAVVSLLRASRMDHKGAAAEEQDRGAR
jgi:phenylacetate-CoA ligase